MPSRTSVEGALAAWDRWMSLRSRLRHLPPRLAHHLGDVGTALDCGSGDGEIARRVADLVPTLSVVGVDVVLQPAPRIPVSPYDGRRLPFADDAFEAVTLIDVLHHCEDPAAPIREALRVASRKVVIKDHFWITRWDRTLLAVSDYLGNRAYGIALPYNFLRMEEWLSVFDAAGARLTSTETFRYSAWDRVKQVVFVLEPG
ncbi:class I SAM-dependent methyltransferase [Thalassobaculum sp. OXR-137]|uniref:class I SAM-dependent methyltransferase n=1 Tax=Thalassobaculum sp. OXR-137 TaxID=3100173 RepID=UPI002AC8CE1A|nr:class I SAM-dependent methyltransferase [Thalassobaculum sp. OXR-137]WPZ35790.1 class I SAM-dependent methyltransferase [Thalassobaculum sp. OXR-137]